MTDVHTRANASRALWETGDYTVVGTLITPIAEDLCETAAIRPGGSVLDVATGHGNTALAAARRDLRVTAIDLVPSLLDRAALRAEAEGLGIDFRLGNAEDLSFPDDTFHAVLSSVGVQFVGDQKATAAELRRVCRPGGRIALANWTPVDLWTELPVVQAKYAPPPAGAPSPMTWGTEPGLRSLFGADVEIEVTTRTFRYRMENAARYVEILLSTYPPFVRMGQNLDRRAFAAFAQELRELVDKWNEATDGSLVLPMRYIVALVDIP